MYVSVSKPTVSIAITLTPEEATSLSHRLNVGRKRLASAPRNGKDGRTSYADQYGVSSDDLAANNGGTLEALQTALACEGFGPVKG